MKRAVLLLVALFTYAGCVSTTVEPPARERHAPLIVTRSGDMSRISWQSKPGLLYTVMYTDGPRARGEWVPLPGLYRVPGTGMEMIFEERLPAGAIRHYRLLINQPTR